VAENRLDTQVLAEQVCDVLVIGGGITGAWTALDCALRGMSTVLIEKNDFGSATSMRSSVYAICSSWSLRKCANHPAKGPF